MHETIIAGDIIKKAKEQGKVKSITVEVGDLGHLPAEELEETLKKMVDWKIKIIRKKAKVSCSCGFTGEPKIIDKKHDFTLFKCPKCGNIPEVALEGKDIVLKDVEVE